MLSGQSKFEAIQGKKRKRRKRGKKRKKRGKREHIWKRSSHNLSVLKYLNTARRHGLKERGSKRGGSS